MSDNSGTNNQAAVNAGKPVSPLPAKAQATDLNRRKIITGAVGAGLSAAAISVDAFARVTEPERVITEVQDWNRYLGDGVDAAPYGQPS